MTYLVYQMQQNPALDTAALNALAAEGWQIIFLRRGAQTPQTPPAPTPRDLWENALTRQHQGIGLLTPGATQ